MANWKLIEEDVVIRDLRKRLQDQLDYIEEIRNSNRPKWRKDQILESAHGVYVRLLQELGHYATTKYEL